MREAFVNQNLGENTLAYIKLASVVMKEYEEQGYKLTVRQLYYQFVARDWIPNTPKEYNRFKSAIGKGRMNGYLDWDLIEDRGRSTTWGLHWEDPADAVEDVAGAFQLDKWSNQARHIEIMCEKDALSGILEPACRAQDVRFTANRGYSSLSMMYRIGQRLEQQRAQGKQVWIFYLGDHDPSGLDMDRDIVERLELFSGGKITFLRIALTMDQIERLEPPENPTKVKDSRAAKYIAEHGESSWELDALDPDVLVRLINAAVDPLREEDGWETAVSDETEMREQLETWVREYRQGS